MSRAPSSPVAESQADALYLALFDHLNRGDDLATLSSILLRIEALPHSHPRRASLLQCARGAIALRQDLEEHQHKERAFRAVFENAQALTELKDLDTVLYDIVERGRKLLGSDIAWLAGEETDRVRVLAIDGTQTEAARHMHGPARAGIAGYVAGTRAAFTTQDYLNDTHFSHDSGIDAAIRGEGLQSVIAVPILSEAMVIGVLIVGDRYKRSYQPWEVSILATLAAHASVAIRNARTFELKQQALLESERANGRLQEKIAELHQAAEAHDQLSEQLAQGSGIQPMLDVVANILNAHTTFLDPAGVPLFASPEPERDARTAAPQQSDHLFRKAAAAAERSRQIGHSVAVDHERRGHTRVMAVSSGEDHLGALLIEATAPLSEHGIRIFERCTTAMAVLTLLVERRSTSARQGAYLTMRALLDGSRNRPDNDIAERARAHGLDIEGTLLLVIAEVEGGKSSYVARKIRSRLKAHPNLVSELDGLVVAVINRGDVDPCRHELEATLFEELKISGLATISAPLEEAGALPAAYESARNVLSLSKRLNRRNRVVHEPELAMYAILFQKHSAGDLKQLVEANLGALLGHDGRRNTRLTRTLLTFMDHRHNTRLTARELGIHVNTAHNRLETIDRLIGPWREQGRTAELHMALKLWALLPEANGSAP